MTRFRVIRLLLPALLVVGALLLPGTASASSCGSTVYNEAYHGVPAGYHTQACYWDALHQLTADDMVYSNVENNLRAAMARDARVDRALAAASTQAAAPTAQPPARSIAVAVVRRPASTPTVPSIAGGRQQPATHAVVTSGRATGADQGLATDALLRMRGSAALPIPVIVLGTLSVLLMLGGLAGVVVRRRLARRDAA
jgi:hypothetical protein